MRVFQIQNCAFCATDCSDLLFALYRSSFCVNRNHTASLCNHPRVFRFLLQILLFFLRRFCGDFRFLGHFCGDFAAILGSNLALISKNGNLISAYEKSGIPFVYWDFPILLTLGARRDSNPGHSEPQSLPAKRSDPVYILTIHAFSLYRLTEISRIFRVVSVIFPSLTAQAAGR